MNKAVFQWAGFHFPTTVTFVHTLVSGLGAFITVRVMRIVKPASLSWDAYQAIGSLSFLFCINILFSNISLDYVSVSFHQIVRATIPAFTVVIMFFWLSKTYSRERLLSLAPICGGVALACYGDIDFTVIGAFLTFMGSFLSALKGCVTNRILVGPMKLHTLDVLHYLGPMSAFQLAVLAYLKGEVTEVAAFWEMNGSMGLFSLLILNGLFAFCTNVVSFLCNKHTSPVTMTVAGNVKLVCTILFGIIMFGTVVTPLNGIGLFISIAGACYYSYVEYFEKYRSEAPVSRV